MSSSIVKKSLDLFKEDLDDYMKPGKYKKSTLCESSYPYGRERTSWQKERSSLKGKHRKERNVKESNKTTVADDKSQEYDNTEDNLYLMAKMAHLDGAKQQIVSKVLDHNRGKLSKNKPTEQKSTANQQSVFSDRDFDQFEKDYDLTFGDNS